MINWLTLAPRPKQRSRRGYCSEAMTFISRWSSEHGNFAALSQAHLWCFHEWQYRSRMSSWLRYQKGNQTMWVQLLPYKRFVLRRKPLISLFFHSSSVKWQRTIVFYKYPWAGFHAAQIHTQDRFAAEGDLLKLSDSAVNDHATVVKKWRHEDIEQKYWVTDIKTREYDQGWNCLLA